MLLDIVQHFSSQCCCCCNFCFRFWFRFHLSQFIASFIAFRSGLLCHFMFNFSSFFVLPFVVLICFSFVVVVAVIVVVLTSSERDNHFISFLVHKYDDVAFIGLCWVLKGVLFYFFLLLLLLAFCVPCPAGILAWVFVLNIVVIIYYKHWLTYLAVCFGLSPLFVVCSSLSSVCLSLSMFTVVVVYLSFGALQFSSLHVKHRDLELLTLFLVGLVWFFFYSWPGEGEKSL